MTSVGPKWAKIARDLWLSKTRTVLVVLSIAIGAFAGGVILSSRELIDTQLNGGYAACNPSQATIYSEPFPATALATVKGMKGVAEVEGRRQVTVEVKQGSKWQKIRLDALCSYTDAHLDRLAPETGHWPPARGEVFLERASAGKQAGFGHLALGETVQIKLADDRVRPLRFSGRVHNATDVAPVFSGSLSGFVTRETLADLGENSNFDQFHITFTAHGMDKEAVRKEAQKIRRKLQLGGLHVYGMDIPEPGRHPAAQANDSIMVILGALGVLMLFLSGLLVVNTITALLAQQTKQIGIMKSVGATRAQVSGVYFAMVGILGLLALAVSVPASLVATRAFTGWVGNMMNCDPAPHSFTLLGLTFQLVIALLVPFAAAAGPILSATRVSVRQALISTGISAERVNRGVQGRRLALLPRPMSLALRNTFRRKSRLGLTLLTLCLGGAVFVGVLSVRQSLYRTMDDAFKYSNYDVAVNLNGSYPTERLTTEAATIPGVVAAECWNYASAEIARPDGEPGNAYRAVGLPPKTDFLRPTVVAGRWLKPDDENVVVVNTNVTKSEPQLTVGKRVRLRLGKRETDFTVVGVVRGVMTGPTVYLNQKWFAEFIGEAGRAGSVNVRTARHDSASEAKAADAVEAHLKAVGLPVSGHDDLMADIRKNIGKEFDILIVILLAMALLVSVVGGLGLAGTMGMNVMERTKEIGVMRAIGAADSSVVAVFVLEGMVIGLIGWALGTASSVPIGKLLSDSVGTQFMNAPLTYSFSVLGVAGWLVLSALISTIASLAPALRASRITVRDVLSYEG